MELEAHMNKQTRRMLWWLPWVAMLALGSLYLGELVREMARQG
jgi:hypothetical protein